ncbi:MAG: hypothetical protein ACYCOU_08120 [Sulfobacillus sp.]
MIDPIYLNALVDLAIQEEESGDEWFVPEFTAVWHLVRSGLFLSDPFWRFIIF